MTTPPEMHHRDRLLCFDGLRGVLASYVMVHHIAPLLALSGVAAQAAHLFDHGTAAVDVFLILSGLVIVQSLAAFQDRPWPFLAARATRLFPCYLLALAMASVAVSFAPPWDAMDWLGDAGTARLHWTQGWPDRPVAHLLMHLTMTHGLLPNSVLPYVYVSILGPAWSLSNEWQFYIFIAALVAWIGRRTWTAAFLLLAVAAVAIPANAILLGEMNGFTMASLLMKAHYFALGIATTVLFRPRIRRVDAWGLLFCLLATTLIAGFSGGAHKMLPPLVWAACALAQRFPQVLVLRPLRWFLQTRLLLWLGAISYPLYLVHAPIQRVLAVALAPMLTGHGLAFTLIWGAASIALPLGLAAWVHKHVELPGIAWGKAVIRDRWQMRRPVLPPLHSP